MKNSEENLTQRVDNWIQNHNEYILRCDTRRSYDAESIYFSENNKGGKLYFFELLDLIASDNLKNIAALRMLLRCMSENRLFSNEGLKQDLTDDNIPKYVICEPDHSGIRGYKVLPLTNLHLLINEYLEGVIKVNVDFEKLEDGAYLAITED
ncbi:MAG: hypothetical protein EOO90_17055 [Pedobacter sp.]|nr:MAG: hypothetical protein EOO90_17055 [Pedobacter sp.]